MVGKESDTMSFVVPEDAQDGDTIHMVIQGKVCRFPIFPVL